MRQRLLKHSERVTKMKKYIVEVTDKALTDMKSIYNYIAIQLQAPDNAIGQYDRIANAIKNLDELPERIKLMKSDIEKRQGIRQMIVDNYSVFFVVRGEKVIVLRVLYSASNIEKRLMEEK